MQLRSRHNPANIRCRRSRCLSDCRLRGWHHTSTVIRATTATTATTATATAGLPIILLGWRVLIPSLGILMLRRAVVAIQKEPDQNETRLIAVPSQGNAIIVVTCTMLRLRDLAAAAEARVGVVAIRA